MTTAPRSPQKRRDGPFWRPEGTNGRPTDPEAVGRSAKRTDCRKPGCGDAACLPSADAARNCDVTVPAADRAPAGEPIDGMAPRGGAAGPSPKGGGPAPQGGVFPLMQYPSHDSPPVRLFLADSFPQGYLAGRRTGRRPDAGDNFREPLPAAHDDLGVGEDIPF